MKIKFNNIINSVIVLISLICICGAAVYRIYTLNIIGVSIGLALTAIAFFIIQRLQTESKHNILASSSKEININGQSYNYAVAAAYLISAAACFFILFQHRTDQAIISPWQTVPHYFFTCYTAATGLIFYLTLKIHCLRHERTALFLIIIHYFLSLSTTWIIYKIGYGFDPFIHQATMDLIDKTGAVLPKPLYYLGQYSLIVIIHKLTGLSLVWLDKLLVPILATIFLPLLAIKTFSKLFETSRVYLPLILTLLIIPFPYLIATMPQNLAYLFLLFALLIGITCASLYDLILVFLFALAALSIHPIAGIPATLFACALAVYCSDVKLRPRSLAERLCKKNENLKKKRGKKREMLYTLIFFVSTTALPLAFYLFEKTNFSFENLNKPSFSLPRLTIPWQENFILNLIYLYGFNIKLIVGLLALAGIFIYWRHRSECKIFGLYLLMAASLFASYWIAKILPFNFLIDYERGNYSERILLVAAFFLLPFIVSALYFFLDRIARQPKKIALPIYSFIILLSAASLYLSYPRFDRYFNSRGYSTAASDITAARWINENSKGDYIVLANQQTSAAALREFGFAKYYESKINSEHSGQTSKIFYYPIPTSGPLYQYYLNMVYKTSKKNTMLAAMALTGVNESYFILNKYWHAFPKILEEAKLSADGWKALDDGEIYIFKYAQN